MNENEWTTFIKTIPCRAEACAVVLLSGGMDSTICACAVAALYPADRRFAVLVDYGQPHRDQELAYAHRLAWDLDIPLERLSIADAMRALRPAERLANAPHSADGAHPATVPGRNAILLSLAAAQAAARWPLIAIDIWCGATLDDQPGFVDCRPEFFRAASVLLSLGAGRSIDIVTPLTAISKRRAAAVVASHRGVADSVRRSWSCYRGGAAPCGECTPCVLRADAFAHAGLVDEPTSILPHGGDAHRESSR